MRITIKAPRILVAEDDDAFRILLLSHLRDAGHNPVELEDGAELEDYLLLMRRKMVSMPDLILTDLRMPGSSGLEVVRRAREKGLECPIVVLTAFPAPTSSPKPTGLGTSPSSASPSSSSESPSA